MVFMRKGEMMALDPSKMLSLYLCMTFAIVSYEESQLLTFLASLNQLDFRS